MYVNHIKFFAYNREKKKEAGINLNIKYYLVQIRFAHIRHLFCLLNGSYTFFSSRRFTVTAAATVKYFILFISVAVVLLFVDRFVQLCL